VAVAWAALSSAWGSVLARPLIERHGSAALAGSTTLIGGTALLLASLATEPGAATSFATFWGWPAVAGWLFLVVAGSLVGYSIYMQLLRDIGPAKAGSFAFVSPAIAVLLGIAFAGETATAQDFLGMAIMLLAAGTCLYGDKLEAMLRASHSRRRQRDERAQPAQ
jgi:drug/metabolite transporter (DMT)-like permease